MTMTTTVPTPAGRDLRVAVPLHQELLPNEEVLIRPLPPLEVPHSPSLTG